jgi:hypothetical protein
MRVPNLGVREGKPSDRDRSPDDIRQLCTCFFFATQPAAKKRVSPIVTEACSASLVF